MLVLGGERGSFAMLPIWRSCSGCCSCRHVSVCNFAGHGLHDVTNAQVAVPEACAGLDI
jgi:hypothetical protein